MPGFGGGLTLCSHLVRWGQRVTPLRTSAAELPPVERSALELVNEIRAHRSRREQSEPGMMAPQFAEQNLPADPG
jgi:3-oxoacyl-[acyl-carrier-protein] synthase-3